MRTFFEWLPAETLAIIFYDFSYSYLICIERCLDVELFTDEFFKYILHQKYSIHTKERYQTWEYVFMEQELDGNTEKAMLFSDYRDVVLKCAFNLFEEFSFAFSKLGGLQNKSDKCLYLLRELNDINRLSYTNPPKTYTYHRLTVAGLKCIYDSPDFLKLNSYDTKHRLKDNKIIYWYLKTGKTREYKIKTIFTLDANIFYMILDEPRFTIDDEVISKYLMYFYYTKNDLFIVIAKKLGWEYISRLYKNKMFPRVKDPDKFYRHQNNYSGEDEIGIVEFELDPYYRKYMLNFDSYLQEILYHDLLCGGSSKLDIFV